ncbi:MFS transporter [Tetragenococcus koreensis]|uniref:MFS transporter n=1 Tax=Tetragenococcus koreensis TaxID=290335 RepID=UPI002656E869|nr:MFS transporter [Staphylococcus equorum]
MDMFKNNKYNYGAFMLYMTMFLHGIQAIILSQNADYFASQWNSDVAGVFSVIAWTGIGKIVFITFSGVLSDKFGRKPVAMSGVVGYLILFGALLFTQNITLAKLVSFIGGAATSLYDGSINPALMEIYPDNKSTASIFNKGFISVSGVMFPLIVGYLAANNMSARTSILIPFILTALVFIGFFFAKFPDGDIKKEQNISAAEAIKTLESNQSASGTTINKKKQPNFAIDGIIIIAFSFFIYSSFYLFQQVVSIYAINIVQMSEVASRSLASYYQIGAFAAVILSAMFMARGIRDMTLLVVYPLIAGITALTIYLTPNEVTLTIGSAIIGFTAAGGALQMGNSLLNQFFDKNKGRNTSMYFFAMSLGSYIMPTLASSMEASNNFTLIMLLDAVVAFVAFAIMAIIAIRYKHIFGVSGFSNSKKN